MLLGTGESIRIAEGKPVPYQREAMIVIDMWREVERALESAPPGSHEAEALQTEAARLRDEYQRLVILAREHQRPEPPPFPDKTRTS